MVTLMLLMRPWRASNHNTWPGCFYMFACPLCSFVYTVNSFEKIAEDMETMKRRHLEMVQELEENFLVTARENQVGVWMET